MAIGNTKRPFREAVLHIYVSASRAMTGAFHAIRKEKPGLEKSFMDRASPDFATRRAEARKRLDSLDPAMQGGPSADPSRRAWFEAVYTLAEGDPARVPWANLAPRPLTQAWVAAHAKEISGLKVLDVGCGLGDNAECFAAAGAQVTAFDFVGDAVRWAKQRFAATKVTYAKPIFSLYRRTGGKISISSMNAIRCRRFPWSSFRKPLRV